MSRKERNRMTILAGVKNQELTQVQAAELLALGYRQTKRVWRRYQAEGDAGLVHRLRGRAGLRRQPAAVRAQVLARFAEERYADFGPTLLAEELAKEGIAVDHDTVRRWLLAAGKRTVRRRRPVHRPWRERKPCFGAMVQLDGSHHDWFEGRRGEVCADGDGGRCDQHAARTVLRGGDNPSQLRRVRGLGAEARLDGQRVCGSGQYLPLRR